MGCRNACICSGRCSESCYEPERYCGEAENIYDELHGKSREQEEYEKAMEEQYYKDMEEERLRQEKEQMQNYDFERGDVKY
jgi:hypothetical protein